MKLIIDIDKQHFELLQMAVMNGMGDNAQKIIAQGIPLDDALDKIRTEIANLDNLNPTYLSDGRYTIDKTKVLRIIDKYKAESEDT